MSKIPKIIHYCWFGGNPIPEKDKACIESWKKFCPGYTIMEWNESNYDISKNTYMKEPYDVKKWGFVPDYARLDIIYTNGGIYLDTDVEIIHNLDPLLEDEAFMGFEDGKFVALGLGFGASKGNEHIKKMRDVYEDVSFINPDGTFNTLPSPHYTTDYLLEKGLSQNNIFQKIEGIAIYPKEYFCPRDYYTGAMSLTENSYTIHHYSASWLSDQEKKIYVRKLRLIEKYGISIGTMFHYFMSIPDIIKRNDIGGLFGKLAKKVSVFFQKKGSSIRP